MMLKNKRQVVIINDIKSDKIEQAIFISKRQCFSKHIRSTEILFKEPRNRYSNRSSENNKQLSVS